MSSASSEPVFAGGGRTRPLTIRRSATARRMRLSVDPRDGTVRLSLPTRAALKPALAWVEERRGWVENALAALPPPQPIAHGATIPFEGEAVRVEWREGASRTPRLHRPTLWETARAVDESSPAPAPSPLRRQGPNALYAQAPLAGERHGPLPPQGRRAMDCDEVLASAAPVVLSVGGPEEALASRVLRWLRREAAVRLDAETRAVAARAGVTVNRVGVGDPRSRWGSCSASGDIRYSWRLILAPPAVREATVAHEVAHRLHMDHGRAFHAAVARLLGRDPSPERRWLRTHGCGLYWLGRDS